MNELKLFTDEANIILQETPLFNESERSELLSAKQSINDSFAYKQIFRTETEARISVLNDTKHPTSASKYFQSLRELDVHSQNLIQLLFEYKDKQLELQELSLDIEELKEEYEMSKDKRTYIHIKRKQNEYQKQTCFLKNIKREADDRKREILMWNKIIEELKPEIQEQNISLVDPNEHQLVSYSISFIKQVINTLKNSQQQQYTMDEITNLYSKLDSTLKHAKEMNVLPEILTKLTNEEHSLLEDSTQLQIY